MNKQNKLLVILVIISIIAGGFALYTSAYIEEISNNVDMAYDNVYDSIMDYGK